MEFFQTIWNWISGNAGTGAGIAAGTAIVGGLFAYWRKNNNAFKEDLQQQQTAFRAGTREEVAMLKGAIETFRAEYINIKELADQLQQEREEMQLELMEIRQKLEEAEKREQAKIKVITALEGEVERLEKENQAQATTVEEMRQQNAEMRQQINALHARVAELTQAGAEQQIRNDKIDALDSDGHK